MARALADIEQEIRALSLGERNQLLQSLICDLDAQADPDAEQAWLKESERRLGQIEAGRDKDLAVLDLLRRALRGSGPEERR